MKDRAVSLGDLRDRHPVGYPVITGVLTGVWFGGYVGLLEGSFRTGLFGGCFFTVLMTLFLFVINRRQGWFFPPGLDRESRVAVHRIVRTGAALDDPSLAPAVGTARSLLGAALLEGRSEPTGAGPGFGCWSGRRSGVGRWVRCHDQRFGAVSRAEHG